MIKGLIYFLVLTHASVAYSSRIGASKDITITSFNIKWYGLGGTMSGSSKDEYRDRYIKSYIKKNLKSSDVILFQEIVDVSRLAKKVMGRNWKCTSYSHYNKKHQHVAICTKKGLRFVREVDDDNFILEEVATYHSSRPALAGVIETSKGKKLAHIIGVHLKAFPAETEKRLQQIEAVSDRLAEFDDGVPAIVLGDFNTYAKKKTNLRRDDVDIFDKILRRHDLDFLSTGRKFSYNANYRKARFDHFWVSNNVPVVGKLDVGKACNSDPKKSKGYDNIHYYNEYVSDHCPVSIRLKL